MSNGYRIEFYQTDKGMTLTYWDNLHGNDLSVSINKKGELIKGRKKITLIEYAEMLKKICEGEE